jgi:hypothetical protein
LHTLIFPPLPTGQGVNWDSMYACKVASPYRPKIKGPGDVSNFDKYDEKPVEWCGSGQDAYGDMFIGF